DDADAAAAPGQGGPPGLLVLRDDAGALVGVTIFQPATDAIVHVPPGTLLEVASIGLVSLREAHAAGGEALVQHSLENLLGVHLDAPVAATPSALLDGAPALTVSVDTAVEEVDPGGRVVEVVPAGIVPVDAEAVGPLLTAVGTGTPLDRIVRHQAFWSARL